MKVADLRHLVCPDCRGPLDWHGANVELVVSEGGLVCRACRLEWRARDGFVRLVRDTDVRIRDREICAFCDRAPRLHDPLVQLALPRLAGFTLEAVRRRALELAAFAALPEEDGRPVRVLEVGIATGLNVRPLREALPPGAEVWGTELSVGLLAEARARLQSPPGQVRRDDLKAVLADAHHLPFRDGFFDRALRINLTGGLRDPAGALAEMARVVRPGRPVVALVSHDSDEPGAAGPRRWVRRRLFARLADPHDPRRAVPDGAEDVRLEPVGPHHALLAFRAPAA